MPDEGERGSFSLLVLGSGWKSVLVMAVWAWALALLLTSRPAQASTTEGGTFDETFASLSLTIMATFNFASDSENEAPMSLPEAEGRRERTPMPWLMAGFCDVRGASGIAPLPALPVQGGTVSAGPSSCQENTLQAGNVIDHGKNKIASTQDVMSDPVLLPMLFKVPTWGGYYDLPRSSECREALPRGFARGIEEPPRSDR